MSDNDQRRIAYLQRKYPGASRAAILHDCMKDLWALARSKNLAPAATRDLLILNADTVLESMPGEPMRSIRPEMDHEDFLRYITDKLWTSERN